MKRPKQVAAALTGLLPLMLMTSVPALGSPLKRRVVDLERRVSQLESRSVTGPPGPQGQPGPPGQVGPAGPPGAAGGVRAFARVLPSDAAPSYAQFDGTPRGFTGVLQNTANGGTYCLSGVNPAGATPVVIADTGTNMDTAPAFAFALAPAVQTLCQPGSMEVQTLDSMFNLVGDVGFTIVVP